MSKKKPVIGIVGYGYVGKAMYEFFKRRYRVLVYDPYVKNCSLDVPLVLKDQFIVWVIGRAFLTCLQWAWSGVVTVGFAATMVSLVRSEVTQGNAE